MNKKSMRLMIISAICMMFPFTGFSLSMDEALKNVTLKLYERGLSNYDKVEMIIEVVNIHSNKFDRKARTIRASLFTSLQDIFPKAKIILKEEAISGVSSNAVLIKGTYQLEGSKSTIVLRAISQMNGQLLAKADETFSVKNKLKFENLVVVLPLEASQLNKSVTKTFSKIFRSALSDTKAFNLVSSDAIDSVNADEIQNQYKCTREECSTIVAEQLNAKLVITTQYNKIDDNLYFLTGSLKDVKTGRTVIEKAIQHDGKISTLKAELVKLACQLAETCDKPVLANPQIAHRQSPQAPQLDQEDQLWDLIKSSSIIEDFEDYLVRYPTGKYSTTAKWKLEKLKKSYTNWPSILSFVAAGAMAANYIAIGNNLPDEPECASTLESTTSACISKVNEYNGDKEEKEAKQGEAQTMVIVFGIAGFFLMDSDEEVDKQTNSFYHIKNINLYAETDNKLRLSYSMKW